MSAPVHVVVVYQSLLGIYGDQGNARVLQRRLEWRDLPCRVTFAEPGDPLPDDAQVYLLGGGEDGAQVSAVRALTADGGLHRAVDRGAAVLAVWGFGGWAFNPPMNTRALRLAGDAGTEAVALNTSALYIGVAAAGALGGAAVAYGGGVAALAVAGTAVVAALGVMAVSVHRYPAASGRGSGD